MKPINMISLAIGICALVTTCTQAPADLTSRLEVLDVETCERTIVKEFPYLIEAPNWTQDGKWLIYNSKGKIYRLAADGSGEPEHIETGVAVSCNNDHVISPDGRMLAVSSGTSTDRRSRIFILPLEGGEARLVTPEAPSYLHGWSPDGKTLAYCAERNGEFDVYTIDADPSSGAVEKRLTTEPGLDDGPEYSPDGRYIWFNSVRSGLMQLWRMGADGSDPRMMTDHPDRNAWFGHVSPDGNRVAYITYHKGDLEPGQHLSNRNVELWMLPAEGGEPVRLIRLFGGQGSFNVNSWAPDSRHLAFVSYSVRGQEFPTLEVPEFRELISRDGVQLLDVRTAKEYAAGHIPEAANVDFRSRDFLDSVLATFDPEKPLAIYCRSGIKSASAAGKLVAAGFVVYNLGDGFLAWQADDQSAD